MKKYFNIFSFFLLSYSAQASRGIIASTYSVFVQPKTMLCNSVAPFDVAWNLYVPIDSTMSAADIIQIDVIKLNRRTQQMDSVTNKYRSRSALPHSKPRKQKNDLNYLFCYYPTAPKEYALTFIEDTTLSKLIDDTTYPGPGPYKYLKIRMQPVPANTKFQVAVFTKMSKDVAKNLTDLGFGVDVQRQADYQDLAAQQETSDSHGQWPDYDQYETLYNNSLESDYTILGGDNIDLADINVALTNLKSKFMRNSILTDTYDEINKCLCNLKFSNKKNDSLAYALLIPLNNLKDAVPERLSAVADGRWDVVGNNLDTVILYSEVNKRIKNLNNSSVQMFNATSGTI